MDITRSLGRESAYDRDPDQNLLAKFNTQIRSKVPHLEEGAKGLSIQSPTPLTDITNDLVECARTEYGLELPGKIRIYGKLDSQIYGGSIKVRPMVQIIEDAIKTGRLRNGQIIFEATSGNFSIALGMLRSLSLHLGTLVSSKLQACLSTQLQS